MDVRSSDEFEARLARYLYERSEEARAVRVGEKETSEQAAIVARYADLFTREQHQALKAEERDAPVEAQERLLRLRESCGGGIVVAELAEASDRLENAILAARVEFQGESLPLRTAQAKLAVLDSYADRDELGRLAGDVSAQFNDDRLALLRDGEELEADLTDEPDPVKRSADLKAIDLHALAAALRDARRSIDDSAITRLRRPQVPVAAASVRDCTPELGDLARALTDIDPRVRGVAITRVLLTDGCGPLYVDGQADRLRKTLLTARSAL
jgi:hypothetical protein